MPTALRERIRSLIGSACTNLGPLSGGCVGEVYLAHLDDGRRVVVKVDRSPDPKLHIEWTMLRHLAESSSLPVPGVLACEPGLLVMEHVEHDGRRGPDAEEHAAELLADLHDIASPRYGFEIGTLIGGLDQPNPWGEDWASFYARHRLIEMAEQGERAGRLPASLGRDVRGIAARAGDLIGSPSPPGLVHGDVWSGNVLFHAGRVAAFIDPATYYADPEVELAFITLFSTFGDRFFARYHERRPIRAGFWETRRDLYVVYPLLVHVRLFGGGYVEQAASIVRRLLR